MTSKRSIIIFWALFLVPTIIMAAIASRLLFHEKERLKRSLILSLSERAEAAADKIHLTVQAVQDNMSRSLLEIDTDRRLQTLKSWEASNPLIRNFFILNNGLQLEYPVMGMGSTSEERRFILRYESLFTGRLKFDFNKTPSRDEPHGVIAPDSLESSFEWKQTYGSETESSLQKLLDLARVPRHSIYSEKKASVGKDTGDIYAGKTFAEKTGWIPWFSENRLFILGWVQKQENAPVYGVELELMTLLSRLLVDFSELPEKNVALVLMDGNGHFLHQSGSLVLKTDEEPVTSIALSALLPHWKIGIFVDEKGFVSTRGFFYLSIILLGIFIAAILSGGALLTRHTLKNMEDARQKTSFVSSVSHELKTPLTSIRMYAELLQSKRIKDAGKIERYLSVIVSESQRLTRLINNVLDFGKLEQGTKKYQITSFDLAWLLNQIIDAQTIRIQESGVEIMRCFADEVFMVNSDPDALGQVILNLLDNALKYASEGRFIKFVIKEDDTGLKEAFFLLKIYDNGPGIPKEQQSAIFEKFHRVDNSLTSKHPGSGLGLSIARKILRDLEGDLLLDELGVKSGCCFTARIKKT